MQEDIFRIQAKNSIICEYFCIEFIGFMLAGKTWIDYTSLFSPYDFDKNDNVILSFFKNEVPLTQLNLSYETQHRLNEISNIKNILLQKFRKEK